MNDMNTKNESRSVILRESFSPDSMGTQNTNRFIRESITIGRTRVVTKNSTLRFSVITTFT